MKMKKVIGLIAITVGAVFIYQGFPAVTPGTDAGNTTVKSSPKTLEKDGLKDSSVIYKEGVHYTVLDKKLDFPSNHVLEYFWYGCPHCHTADEFLQPWSEEAGERVVLEQRHSQLGSSWISDAKIFYTIKEMNLDDKVHFDYFSARQKGSVSSKSLEKILEENSVDPSEFNSVMNGDNVGVAMSVNRMVEQSLKTMGVPSLVVGGKYLVRLEGMGGSWSNLTKIIDYLVDKK